MIPDFEVLLPLGALAFYLYDCAQPLHADELLLAHGRGRWTVMPGSGLGLGGREFVFTDPLRPQRATYRVRWAVDDPRGLRERAEDVAAFEAALAPLRPVVVLLLVLLAVALPVTSLAFGAGAALLAVFAAYYLAVLAGLAIVHRRRTALGLTPRGYWALAFDVLACAPFAVNLLRRLSLRRGLAGDPLAYACDAFDAASLLDLRRAVGAAVEPQLAAAEPDSPARRATEALLARLEAAR